MPNYVYPGTESIKNKLGVRGLDQLQDAEARLSSARMVERILAGSPDRTFDGARIKAIQHHIFQDIYEWAGRTQVPLSDGTVASEPVMRKPGGKPFAAGPDIPRVLHRFAASLRKASFLRGLPRRELAYQAADLMADLNAIHPFREGNGRTQRLFMMELAQAAGHRLDFSVVSGERMTLASIAAHERGDLAMMRRMFDEISDPPRIAALREAIDFLESQKYPWNDRYLATTEPGHAVAATLAGRGGAHFMARTGSEILVGQTEDPPKPRPDRGENFVLRPTAWPDSPSTLATAPNGGIVGPGRPGQSAAGRPRCRSDVKKCGVSPI